MKLLVESRSTADVYKGYQTAFADLLANNTPPKSDKGFIMVKDLLDAHVPSLKAAQVSKGGGIAVEPVCGNHFQPIPA